MAAKGSRAKATAKRKPPAAGKKISSAEARRRGKMGGRPRKLKQSEVEAALLRDKLEPHVNDTIDRLLELRHCGDPAVSLRACTALLDRRYGTPIQSVEVGAPRPEPDLDLSKLTAKELANLKQISNKAAVKR